MRHKTGREGVDINKGESEHPDLRSRPVAQEYNNSDMDGIFTGAPPLEAFLLSEAVTIVFLVNDVLVSSSRRQ